MIKQHWEMLFRANVCSQNLVLKTSHFGHLATCQTLIPLFLFLVKPHITFPTLFDQAEQ